MRDGLRAEKTLHNLAAGPRPGVSVIIAPSPFLLDERVFPFLGPLKVATELRREQHPVNDPTPSVVARWFSSNSPVCSTSWLNRARAPASSFQIYTLAAPRDSSTPWGSRCHQLPFAARYQSSRTEHSAKRLDAGAAQAKRGLPGDRTRAVVVKPVLASSLCLRHLERTGRQPDRKHCSTFGGRSERDLATKVALSEQLHGVGTQTSS